MIQATEIRIGNFIYDETGRVVVVSAIEPDKDLIWLRFNDGLSIYHNDLKNVLSIPVDDEWLRKLEFIPETRLGFERTFEYEGLRIKIGDYVACLMNNDRVVICARVTSIHQLQNLFFALKGTELRRID